jgi:hypothetical protein
VEAAAIVAVAVEDYRSGPAAADKLGAGPVDLGLDAAGNLNSFEDVGAGHLLPASPPASS